ncbi:MAG: HAMP domain-containing histidine kinase [Nitrospira sp.]|nr:HAMP domain-containing histidine kinase [Nitrospira sp.]
MPEVDAEKAFERSLPPKSSWKGTGLGLFLSRETVVAHGGGLELASEVGRGTTVTMTLPAKRTDPAHSTEERDTASDDLSSR